VAARMGLVLLIALRLPGLDEFTRGALWLIVFFPGALLFMPMIHNVHNYWEGYIFGGAVVNWIFYTWGTWAFMEKWRRKRALRRAQPAADVAPPDRLPPDQRAK
jgi:hypothetical protein